MYVNRLEQPHCLRNTRVSGAVQPHRNRGHSTIEVKRIFFCSSHATNPLHVRHARQCVPGVRLRLKTAGVMMQRNFKFERAWSDFTGAGWNCRWAGSGIERSGLVRFWAVERRERTPTWAGSSAHMLCSGDTLFHHEEEKLPSTKWNWLPDDRNVF